MSKGQDGLRKAKRDFNENDRMNNERVNSRQGLVLWIIFIMLQWE